LNSEFSLATVVRSLHFQEDRRDLLRDISESAWPAILHLADNARLTLPLAIRCADMLPPRILERVEGSLQSNLRRHSRVLTDWQEIGASFASRGVDYAVLKGLSHWPFYSVQPAYRPQYDFDLYCPKESITQARDAIAELGYAPLHPSGGPPTDHLPAMIRKTGYQWRGDYFDPALPLTVELHYRFWDAARESFDVRSADGFWGRRTIRSVGDLAVSALHPVDCLSYATWHVVRHLVAGNLRLYHVYELAHFLDRTQHEDSFWRDWEQISTGELGVPERIALRLAVEWFGCGMHPVVRESVDRLPPKVNRWFELFAHSPVLASNKDELFLHLSLVRSRRDKFRIASQRIFPRNPPQIVLDAHTSLPSRRLHLRRVAFRAKYMGARALHHLRSLSPLLRSALRWWRAGAQ
jgi:hypothetical protein